MEKEKKKWETPKLICLYRGRPEEAVLGTCKAGNNYGPDIAQGCKGQPPGGGDCQTPTNT